MPHPTPHTPIQHSTLNSPLHKSCTLAYNQAAEVPEFYVSVCLRMMHLTSISDLEDKPGGWPESKMLGPKQSKRPIVRPKYLRKSGLRCGGGFGRIFIKLFTILCNILATPGCSEVVLRPTSWFLVNILAYLKVCGIWSQWRVSRVAGLWQPSQHDMEQEVHPLEYL